tara:strand:- start:2897 stop:4327 length:1431 start_codon:yes stop_codon:yes gene_type:complete
MTGIAAITLSACTSSLQTKDGANKLIDAHRLYDNKQYKSALAGYHETLQSSQDNYIRAEAYQGLARSYRQQKQYDLYLQNLSLASEIIPERYEEELARALWQYGSNTQKAEARQIFLNQARFSGEAQRYLSEIADKDHSPEKSREHFEQALSLLKKDYMLRNDPDGKRALNIAQMLYFTQDTLKDCKQSEHWYRKAIDKGLTRAAYELATLWQECAPQKRSAEDIFSLMLQAAERGHVNAMRHVAKAYQDGNGVQQNIQEALSWYKKLGPRANTRAIENIADNLLFEQNDLEQALPFYKMAANKGSKKATLIAQSFGLKAGVPLSDETIFSELKSLSREHSKNHKDIITKITKHVASLGHPDALFILAQAEQDDDAAIALYKEAAENGSAEAHLYLARLYSADIDNPENLTLAHKHYLAAAELGHVSGQYQAGLMYGRGFGVPKDIEKAQYWLRQAQSNGYDLATDTLKALNQPDE